MSVSVSNSQPDVTNKNIKQLVNSYVNGNPQNLPPIGQWDTSRVTNMARVFSPKDQGDLLNNFNEPLDGWNVSNVTNMMMMFDGASSLNQPLNNW